MKIRFISSFLLLLALAIMVVSCEKGGPDYATPKVTIIYSAGAYYDIANSLDKNISEIQASYLPSRYEGDKVILVSQRLAAGNTSLAPATISQIYRDDNTGASKTTLLQTLPDDVDVVDTEDFLDILGNIKSRYPNSEYTLVVSTHGSGWLPAGYGISSNSFDMSVDKSFGDNQLNRNSVDIIEFGSRSPIHFKCVIFDVCLMGGIEVAYELKDITDHIIFSPAKVPMTGFQYNDIIRRIYAYQGPDYDGICRDFVSKQKSSGSSATVSFVVTDKLGDFALLCKRLFNTYNMKKCSNIPGYNENCYCFADLYSLFYKCGLSLYDMSAVAKQISVCVPYRYAYSNSGVVADEFYWGLSMFNPYYYNRYFQPLNGGSERIRIDEYYKTLKWNKATGLVK